MRGNGMLMVIKRMAELPFSALMEIYREGNAENGAQRYPQRLEAEQRRCAEADFYTYLLDTFFRVPDAAYCIWEDGGRAVSALRLEPYRDGWLLEALETAPELRGRGYARALICAVQQELRAQGKPCVYSHVSRRNAASMAVHARCGFRQVQDYAVYLDGSVNRGAVTLCWRA